MLHITNVHEGWTVFACTDEVITIAPHLEAQVSLDRMHWVQPFHYHAPVEWDDEISIPMAFFPFVRVRPKIRSVPEVNHYAGVPYWEQVWSLFYQLYENLSSDRDDIYARFDIFIGTVEEVAQMTPEQVQTIIQEETAKRHAKWLAEQEEEETEL